MKTAELLTEVGNARNQQVPDCQRGKTEGTVLPSQALMGIVRWLLLNTLRAHKFFLRTHYLT